MLALLDIHTLVGLLELGLNGKVGHLEFDLGLLLRKCVKVKVRGLSGIDKQPVAKSVN